ncbi:MAG TPA: lipoyl domain-containing protein [Planctomycetaceae bacterium]|nr:lipoyl domain-containing protein [Planctomycetaceae bacterium]
MTPYRNPIRIPDLQAGDQPIEVGVWLVEEGQFVSEGDRIVELMFPGLVFVLSSEYSGTLVHRVKHEGAPVHSGDLIGWIDSNTEQQGEDLE